MASKAKLRRKIRKLKKRELALTIECNAARARAGEAAEALSQQFDWQGVPFGRFVIDTGKLDG